MRTDRELLDRHIAGDKDAFAELFRRHHDRLCVVAAGIIGSEADDAVQEAFISAHRNASRFRGDSSVRTWLHRITVNKAIDIARRRPLLDDCDEPSYPAWRIEQADQKLDIRKGWGRLPPGQRACLLLVDMLGYPFAEAAQILRVSESTLKSRCARGRARLADRMHGYR
jgi:RNA polymerase sigma-70 factor, ECF subfamily